MNIIVKQGAARPDDGAIGSELETLLREGTLPLPDLPDSAAGIARLSGSPPARAQALAGIVSAHPPLLLRVMHVGRLAAAEPDVRLDTLADVIAWVGPAEAGDIAYTAALQDALLAGHAPNAFALRLWQTCIAAGIWSREAATLARRRSRLTYICGLLHEIGKPATALACADLAARLGRTLDEAGAADLVHHYHGAVAEQLARRWQLPDEALRCIRGWRGGRSAGEDDRELPVVYLGHQLAELVAEQGPEFAREALAADAVLDVLNIGPDRFRGLVGRADWVMSQARAY